MEERCKNGLPETTRVNTLVNIVTIEPGCLLDAGNYQIEGVYQSRQNASDDDDENLPAPVIMPQWDLADMNMSEIFMDYPHLQKIQIPNFHQIDDTLDIHAERNVINALKKSAYRWYEDWSVWVTATLAIVTLLGVMWFTYQNGLCPQLPRRKPKDEKDIPHYERHPPEQSPIAHIYPDVQAMLREPTAPATLPDTADATYSSVHDSRHVLHQAYDQAIAAQRDTQSQDAPVVTEQPQAK